MGEKPAARLIEGNAIVELGRLAENSVDAIVTDPPYGLEFMGKEFDSADGFRRSLNRADAGRDSVFGRTSRTSPEYRATALFSEFTRAWAAEALRVLKPGGHLLAFGGARTYHRMASAVEDAGFEIRDQIMWVYGSGFPKSLDVAKAIARDGGDAAEAALWQGWGTALKPAHEPVAVARKPLDGTVARNVLAHGTGALNIDACRVEHVTVADGNLALNPHLRGSINGGNGGRVFPREEQRRVAVPHQAGRWPANFVHDGSDEVLERFPEAAYSSSPNGNASREGEATRAKRYTREGSTNFAAIPGQRRFDSGSAARFFYHAKASRAERGPGNDHPTVKPVAVMRWLVRLATPPGGLVVDPFVGSGTTGVAAREEGFDFLGIDLDPHYLGIARARLGIEAADPEAADSKAADSRTDASEDSEAVRDGAFAIQES